MGNTWPPGCDAAFQAGLHPGALTAWGPPTAQPLLHGTTPSSRCGPEARSNLGTENHGIQQGSTGKAPRDLLAHLPRCVRGETEAYIGL